MSNNNIWFKVCSQNRSVRFLLFLSAVITFFLTSCGKEEKQHVKDVVRPIKMMTIESSTDGLKRAYPGKVKASQSVDLSFKVSGPLLTFPVNEGQNVKKGELIARIDPRDFKTGLDKAKAQAHEAEQQYRRYKDLYVQKQVSEADFDKYKSARDVAKAQKEDAEHALGDTYLKAPFSGVIAKKYVENFQDVRAKKPIASLQDVSSVEIQINVPEAVMARLKEESKGTAIAEFATAPGKQYSLKFKEYSTDADPGTQTYQVKFIMLQPEDLNVLPGMTASVLGTPPSMESKTGDPIVIPAIAVVADESGVSHVWLVDRKTMNVSLRKVTTGNLTGTAGILITDGLKSGETIAVAGVGKLREGMQVRPMDQ